MMAKQYALNDDSVVVVIGSTRTPSRGSPGFAGDPTPALGKAHSGSAAGAIGRRLIPAPRAPRIPDLSDDATSPR